MSAMNIKPTDDIVSFAEGNIPVTGKMIQEWCDSYDQGELPEGYSVEQDSISRKDSPCLNQEEIA